MGNGADDPSSALLASIEDPQRFEKVVSELFPEIFRFFANRVGGEERNDLAAETFAIAFKIRERFDPERGSARSWLYGIATKVLSNHRRSERRRLAAFERAREEFLLLSPTGGEGENESSDSMSLATAIAKLDDSQRDALYLVTVAGLSFDEAAAALGIAPGTLRSRVARGRARLRELTSRPSGIRSARRRFERISHPDHDNHEVIEDA